MRAIPEALQARLDSGCTTLCRCWQIERADGMVLGFTDHDRDLEFDGVVHAAASGLTASAAEQSAGLSIDSQTVEGALSAASITEADLDLGRYDRAAVRQYLVDWRDVAVRVVTGAGTIGRVTRRGHAFEAEVVGLSEVLNRPVGRAFLRTCDLALGSAACGVDLADPAWSGEGTVVAVEDGLRLRASGLGAFAAGLFEGGGLAWLDGGAAGVEGSVRHHARSGGETVIETWSGVPEAVVAGDRFRVSAGCDKRLETCRDRFANLMAFRGFPHLPGDDWVTGYADNGGGHDGGSLFR
ncbi:MAG: DUF2163 domain-containing protein [Pseudomonadota bacterium]